MLSKNAKNFILAALFAWIYFIDGSIMILKQWWIVRNIFYKFWMDGCIVNNQKPNLNWVSTSIKEYKDHWCFSNMKTILRRCIKMNIDNATISTPNCVPAWILTLLSSLADQMYNCQRGLISFFFYSRSCLWVFSQNICNDVHQAPSLMDWRVVRNFCLHFFCFFLVDQF